MQGIPKTLAQTPGPDLACQDAVMESEAFITVKTVVYPHPVAPGQAGMQGLNFVTPAFLVSKRQQLVAIMSRQGGLDTDVKILAYVDT